MQLSYVVLFTLLNCAAVNVAFGDPDFPGRNDGNCNRDVSFHYPPNFSFNRAQTCLKNAKEKQCDQLPAVCLNCTYSQVCWHFNMNLKCHIFDLVLHEKRRAVFLRLIATIVCSSILLSEILYFSVCSTKRTMSSGDNEVDEYIAFIKSVSSNGLRKITTIVCVFYRKRRHM